MTVLHDTRGQETSYDSMKLHIITAEVEDQNNCRSIEVSAISGTFVLYSVVDSPLSQFKFITQCGQNRNIKRQRVVAIVSVQYEIHKSLKIWTNIQQKIVIN